MLPRAACISRPPCTISMDLPGHSTNAVARVFLSTGSHRQSRITGCPNLNAFVSHLRITECCAAAADAAAAAAAAAQQQQAERRNNVACATSDGDHSIQAILCLQIWFRCCTASTARAEVFWSCIEETLLTSRECLLPSNASAPCHG